MQGSSENAGNNRVRKQKISDQLKSRIMNGMTETACKEELRSAVEGEFNYLLSNRPSFNVTGLQYGVRDIIEMITGSLYLDIYRGVFVDKFINLDVYCTRVVHRLWAEQQGLNKNKMWFIRRTRNICEKYNIPINPLEAHKVYRIMRLDGFKSITSIGMVYRALEWLLNYEVVNAKKKRI